MTALLTPEHLDILRRCSRDEQAFDELRQLIETISTPPSSTQTAFHRDILDLQDDFICRIDDQFCFIYVNRAYAHLCQQPAAALLGKQFWSIVPSHDIERIRQIFDAVIATGQPKIDDRIVSLSNGTTMCIEWTNTPLFDRDGDVKGILSVGRDVTARKLAEEALRENNLLLRQIVEHSQEVFYLYDPHQHSILYINPAYETIWGRAARDVYIDPQPFLDALELVGVSNGGTQPENDAQKEYAIVRPTGEVRQLRVRHYPVKNDTGHVLQIVGIAEDVTEKIAAENHRQELQQERERMHLLYHFIHDVTHEFRTPLTIIYTSLHLLMRTTDSQKQQVYQQRIVNQIQMLTRLVDDLNIMARLDSGLLISQDIIQLEVLINQVLEAYRARLPHRLFHLLLPAEALPDLMGSETDWILALNHLLENAVRFSPEDTPITVTLAYEPPHIGIRLEDTGKGITPADLPHIFKRFYRSDVARTTRGFGLGLPIVKKIVELHHGTIEVHSEVNKGSTFIIRIPLVTGSSRVGFPTLPLPLIP